MRQLTLLYFFLLPFLLLTIALAVISAGELQRKAVKTKAISAILADTQARTVFRESLKASMDVEDPDLAKKVAHQMAQYEERLQRNPITCSLAELSLHMDGESDEYADFGGDTKVVVKPAPVLWKTVFDFHSPADAGNSIRSFSFERLQLTAFELIEPGPIEPTSVYVIVAGVIFAAFSVLPIASAWIFRGGITYWMTGIGVVRYSGQPAWRVVCVWRSVLFWSAFTFFCVTTVWLSTASIDDMPIAVVLTCLGIFAALLCFAASLRKPQRSPHDFLCGTYLVPR